MDWISEPNKNEEISVLCSPPPCPQHTSCILKFCSSYYCASLACIILLG